MEFLVYYELEIEMNENDDFSTWVYLFCDDYYDYFNYNYNDYDTPYITSFDVDIQNYYC